MILNLLGTHHSIPEISISIPHCCGLVRPLLQDERRYTVDAVTMRLRTFEDKGLTRTEQRRCDRDA